MAEVAAGQRAVATARLPGRLELAWSVPAAAVLAGEGRVEARECRPAAQVARPPEAAERAEEGAARA